MMQRSAPLRLRHRQHANPLAIRGPVAVPNWLAVYGRQAPMALDIGCGTGQFLLELARRNPAWNVLGLDIRPHLIAAVNQQAAALGLPNAHAVFANANAHLEDLVADKSVAFVSVNFPDPCYKRRHHKRRVVQSGWVQLLAKKLTPQAQVHVMTDYQPIAMQIRNLLQDLVGMKNCDGLNAFSEQSTTGIVSEREIKHMRRNESIYRMRFAYM